MFSNTLYLHWIDRDPELQTFSSQIFATGTGYGAWKTLRLHIPDKRVAAMEFEFLPTSENSSKVAKLTLCIACKTNCKLTL